MRVKLDFVYSYTCDECNDSWTIPNMEPMNFIICPHCHVDNKIEAVEQTEQKSNSFLMRLKIPETDLRVAVRELKKDLNIEWIDTQQILFLASKFDVPVALITRRLQELGYLIKW